MQLTTRAMKGVGMGRGFAEIHNRIDTCHSSPTVALHAPESRHASEGIEGRGGHKCFSNHVGKCRGGAVLKVGG